MYGSFLYNSWAALIAFTIYFVLALQSTLATPLYVLIGSFIAAVIGFVVMYPVRLFLNYIFFTPEEIVQKDVEENVIEPVNVNSQQPIPSFEQVSLNEFEDESSEEIAKVVRTMMQAEGEA